MVNKGPRGGNFELKFDKRGDKSTVSYFYGILLVVPLTLQIDRRTRTDVDQFQQRNSPGDGRVFTILQLLKYCNS